jgi:hydroxymethylglutaryl-CoA synthase
LEIDLTTVGQYSTDADDFFRPLGQTTAQVRGGHSIKCYRKAFAGAFADHCAQRGQSELDVIKDTDFFVLHTPFRNMPEMAYEWLLSRHGLGHNGDGLFAKPLGHCLREATDEIAYTGNLYNGALYFVLAHLLRNLCCQHGEAMVGKKIVLGSYGSGATMVVLQARIAPGAPAVIRRWNLPGRDSCFAHADYETYRHWAENYDCNNQTDIDIPNTPGRFYLKEVRSDGYRIYAIS